MKTKNVKRNLALAASAFALSASFVGCTDYTEFSEGDIKLQEFNKNYDQAFIEKYGTPDPNNKWGLDEELPCMGWGGSVATRAGQPSMGGVKEGQIMVNRNQWVERDGSATPFSSRPYRKSSLAYDIQIPGWPHDNGLYYAMHNYNDLEKTYTAETLPENAIPCGDVTEYEIQFVSAWFRSHPAGHPELEKAKVNLHLSDFFVQNVSCDADQDTYEWTDEVSDFITGPNGEIQYIGKNGTNKKANYNLDQLRFMAIGGDRSNPDGTGWTHLYNFNHGNSNDNPEESTGNPNREIAYITSSGTEHFACHPVINTLPSMQWCTNYVLVHLMWYETVKNTASGNVGDKNLREGYYLAFDFAANQSGTEYPADGYYSNWILKITPGHFNRESDNVRRVFCEDLGGSFDFDFNDIVFDVAYDADHVPVITIQAAGGVLPACIGVDPTSGNGETYEVHNILGETNYKPTNAVNGDAEHYKPVAIYRGTKNSGNTVQNVPIWIKNNINGTGEWVSYAPTEEESDKMNIDGSSWGKPSSTIDKSDGANIAPRSFATKLSWSDTQGARQQAKWTAENIAFSTCYPNFEQWVKGEYAVNTKEWYEITWHTENNIFVPPYEIGKKAGESGEPYPNMWHKMTPTSDYPNLDMTIPAYVNTFGADNGLVVAGYDGQDAMWRYLENGASQLHIKVHFTTPESNTKLKADDLQAAMVLADRNAEDTEMLKPGTSTSFTKSDIADSQYSNFAYVATDQGKDFYSVEFTFSKEQMKSSKDASGNAKYVDNIFLFIKAKAGVNASFYEMWAHY